MHSQSLLICGRKRKKIAQNMVVKSPANVQKSRVIYLSFIETSIGKIIFISTCINVKTSKRAFRKPEHFTSFYL